MPVQFPVKKLEHCGYHLGILAILADEPTFVQTYGYEHPLRISILMSPGGRRVGLTRRRPLALLKTGGFWSGPPWGHG